MIKRINDADDLSGTLIRNLVETIRVPDLLRYGADDRLLCSPYGPNRGMQYERTLLSKCRACGKKKNSENCNKC